jgi:hypothetical protein
MDAITSFVTQVLASVIVDLLGLWPHHEPEGPDPDPSDPAGSGA